MISKYDVAMQCIALRITCTRTHTHTHTHTHTQTLEEDVDGFVTVVEGLGREAKALVSANHFDASNISARQVAT